MLPAHSCGLAVVIGCFGLTATHGLLEAAQTANGPALSVNATAQNHPISPDIYGINDYSEQGLASKLRLSVRRWGGDATTRYNWLLDTYNAAADWYYEDFPSSSNDAGLPDHSTFNQVVETANAAVAGVLQIDLKIPGSIPPGSAVPLEIQIGTATSQPNITMAVK